MHCIEHHSIKNHNYNSCWFDAPGITTRDSWILLYFDKLSSVGTNTSSANIQWTTQENPQSMLHSKNESYVILNTN